MEFHSTRNRWISESEAVAETGAQSRRSCCALRPEHPQPASTTIDGQSSGPALTATSAVSARHLPVPTPSRLRIAKSCCPKAEARTSSRRPAGAMIDRAQPPRAARRAIAPIAQGEGRSLRPLGLDHARNVREAQAVGRESPRPGGWRRATSSRVAKCDSSSPHSTMRPLASVLSIGVVRGLANPILRR